MTVMIKIKKKTIIMMTALTHVKINLFLHSSLTPYTLKQTNGTAHRPRLCVSFFVFLCLRLCVCDKRTEPKRRKCPLRGVL